MNGDPPPVVRLMALCDDVALGGQTRREVTCIRLLTNIYSTSDPPYPHRLGRLCIHAQITECRGPVRLVFRVVRLETGTPIWQSSPKLVDPGTDPTLLQGITQRILGLSFPAPGQYEVELECDGQVIGAQLLVLR